MITPTHTRVIKNYDPDGNLEITVISTDALGRGWISSEQRHYYAHYNMIIPSRCGILTPLLR